jgi:succinate-semialdehyde dehydrogenase/glutarate-semialdehyde dehydrogenase
VIIQLSLELGGNAPFIVFDDADLNQAVNALMFAKFRNAGQACIAANRVLVQEKVYDEFSHLLAAAVNKSLKVGHGMHGESTMGPLINQAGLRKVIAYHFSNISLIFATACCTYFLFWLLPLWNAMWG